MDYKVCESATIKDTGTAKGRGVYATRQIGPGEIIEICPVALVQWDEIPEQLRLIVFNWGALTKGPRCHAIALGWGSMYNHGNPSNVRYSANASTLSLAFSAARHIDAGEELNINYNESYGDIHSSEDIWFQGRGVTPI
jgi:hypothetical protein